jgi:hypothetical protein
MSPRNGTRVADRHVRFTSDGDFGYEFLSDDFAVIAFGLRPSITV